MRTPSGIFSNAVLGLLMLLTAGAIVLSLETAPQVAQEQLQAAAKNTMAAGSFVFTDDVSIHEPGPTAQLGGRSEASTSQRVAYQAPDRVEISSTSASGTSLLVIGDKRYEKTNGGPWMTLPPLANTGTSTGAQEVALLLFPLESLAGATSVTLRGSKYGFSPGGRSILLGNLFGQLASKLSSIKFSATVSGEFVSTERIAATQGRARFLIDFGYLQVGNVPPIVAPPVS
ncbi:MAG TPA: hypothetical protein VMR97_07485 [Acidimicrobiales bacterium]|nr:hypothetical protein [Acidimicrobiales bacterium]